MANTIHIGNVGVGENATTRDSVAAQLSLCDPSMTLFVDIHSQGGSVFEGFAIFNLIKEWSGKTVARVKTAAFSIASYIAMAADEIEIADNGFFMVHNPFDESGGDDEELVKKAAVLKDMRESMMDTYAAKTGLALALVQDMMKKESFIGAKQAISLGLADRVIDMTPTQPLNYQLPEAVFVAMYGAKVDGEQKPEHKETNMPETTFAARLKTLKAKYPNAKLEFIVKCMEEEKTDEEVTEAHAQAMEEENETLASQLATAMEEMEELKSVIAKFNAEGETTEEEEPTPAARLRPTGTKPVAAPASAPASTNPKADWDDLVGSFLSKGKSRPEALKAANRVNPGLRQRLVDSANA